MADLVELAAAGYLKRVGVVRRQPLLSLDQLTDTIARREPLHSTLWRHLLPSRRGLWRTMLMNIVK
jgi:hypothetical protein